MRKNILSTLSINAKKGVINVLYILLQKKKKKKKKSEKKTTGKTGFNLALFIKKLSYY